jgi:hypothetical protein
VTQPSLRPAPKKEPVQEQQDHRADDRSDEACWLSGLIPAECLAEITGNKRAGDAEQNRNDATAGIFSRHQQFRDGADDKADDQNPNDRMCAEVHMRAILIREPKLVNLPVLPLFRSEFG